MEQLVLKSPGRQDTPRRHSFSLIHAWLLVILLLAFALRVHRLDQQSLWYDEAVTAQIVQQGLTELAQWTADDIQPPLYYVMVASWTRVAGVSEWALRFPSVVCGLLMVVLIYGLARRLFGRGAGVLAAILGAVHPLWLYYSQEARMYALLTALGMLAGYALLRVLAASGSPRQRRLWWVALGLSSIALLYSHYFAIFLLLAYTLYFLAAVVFAPVAGRRRQLLIEAVVVVLITLAAYLPWLPNALARYQVDRSYWQGTLKLNEALRHLAISFTTGETVLEAQARPLALGLVLLAAICLLALLGTVWRWPSSASGKGTGNASPDHGPGNPERRALGLAILFTLLYLLVPIGTILFLSYGNPKFNPRYLMLASPGLLLLLAGGLGLPFRRTGGEPVSNQLTYRETGGGRRPHTSAAPEAGSDRLSLWRGLSLLILAVLLVVFLYGDRNWFEDPAFTKDDWRGAVAYVQRHLADDERVILVSGHALPAWRYYAPDIEPVRLPAIEILDVNAVLDLDAVDELEQALAGTQGAWLIQWQDEVVDPTAVVPLMLDSVGEEQPISASFWGLGQPRHYRWPAATTFDARPAPEEALNANFGALIALVGWSQPHCPPDANQACPILLFWQSQAPLNVDYMLSAQLESEQGIPWGPSLDRRLAAYDYPTFRWSPGTTVVAQLPVAAGPGTPPGLYRLRLTVYDGETGQPLEVLDEAGNPQGQQLWLEPVAVDQLIVDGPQDLPPVDTALAASPHLRLLMARLSQETAEVGQELLLETWWLAQQAPDRDYALRWQWVDPENRIIGEDQAQPAGPDYPTSQWQPGNPIHSQLTVQVPEQALNTPGAWQLRVGLVDETGAIAGETIDLPVQVQPGQQTFSLPKVAVALHTLLGGSIEVVGLTEPVPPLQPGATIPITVVWRVREGVDTPYTGLVHLTDSSGQLVAQDDHAPAEGRPTSSWLAGEVFQDRYTLTLPPDLSPGDYTLVIGLYSADQPGLPRLLTEEGSDGVLVGPLPVKER